MKLKLMQILTGTEASNAAKGFDKFITFVKDNWLLTTLTVVVVALVITIPILFNRTKKTKKRR